MWSQIRPYTHKLLSAYHPSFSLDPTRGWHVVQGILLDKLLAQIRPAAKLSLEALLPLLPALARDLQ